MASVAKLHNPQFYCILDLCRSLHYQLMTLCVEYKSGVESQHRVINMAYHARKIIHWFHEYANRNLLPIIAVSMKSIKRKEFGLGILQNIRLKHSSRSMNLHINELACIHLISLGNLAYIAIEKLLVTTRGLWISFDVNRKGGALQFSVYFE